MTMNGGTSLRPEGIVSRFAASSIAQPLVFGRRRRPAVAAFGGFRRSAAYQLGGHGAMGRLPRKDAHDDPK
jgi:hypothetical protein